MSFVDVILLIAIILTSPLSPFTVPFIMWPLLFILIYRFLTNKVFSDNKITKEDVIDAQEYSSSAAEYARNLLEKYSQQHLKK